MEKRLFVEFLASRATFAWLNSGNPGQGLAIIRAIDYANAIKTAFRIR
jgi:hypothetical protein